MARREKLADIGRELADETSRYFGQNSALVAELILSNLEYKEPESLPAAQSASPCS